jgi:hypothetical protein
MRWRRRPTIAVISVALAASLGCLNEYHPEYSPRTSYSFSQNVSYPTTVVQNVVVAPPPTPSSSPTSRPISRPSPSRPVTRSSDGAGRLDAETPEERPAAPLRAVESRSRLADESPVVRWSEEEAPARGVESRVDAAALRTRCSAGDAESCRHLPGVHINGNVRLFGNVVIFGDVFMNDSLASADSGRDG